MLARFHLRIGFHWSRVSCSVDWRKGRFSLEIFCGRFGLLRERRRFHFTRSGQFAFGSPIDDNIFHEPLSGAPRKEPKP